MKPKRHFTLCALILTSVGFMAGCQKIQPASAEQLATQYGETGDPLAAGTETTNPAADTGVVADQGSRNRFGFGGSEIEAPVKPLRRDTENYSPVEERTKLKDRVSNMKKTVTEAPKIDAPKPPTPPAINSNLIKLGFANSLPGDQLHVTLPGEYASLGPISIERIDPSGNSLGQPWARGTQMQIPNPRVPGGKIYFKVP